MASEISIESTNPAGAFPGLLWDKGTSGALIVVHEVWGLTQAIQKQATVIVNKCDVTVLAVDLFRGWKTEIISEAVQHFEGLDWDAALTDVAAAVKFLRSKGCEKVAITGFSMGGCISLAAAVKYPDLISACMPCYGVTPDQVTYPSHKIQIPVQAHFCKKDRWVNAVPQVYLNMKEKMEESNVALEFYEYDAGHSFLDSEDSRHDANLTDLCYSRMKDFLEKHLR